MCKDDTCQPPLPANDAEKLHAYQIVFYEMVFSIQPSLFEHIMLWKSAKEIKDTLHDLFEGSKNTKDKHLTYVVDDFDTFSTTPGESVSSTSNYYWFMANNTIVQVIGRTPL